MENQIENMITAVLNSDELTVHNNSSGNGDLNSSDDDDAPKVRSKKVKRFSDSESEPDHFVLKSLTDSDKSKASDSEEEMIKSVPQKSRIKMISNESSDSEGPKTEEVVKNAEQQLRMKNKRNKIRDKFKSLVSSRGKDGMKDNEKENIKELDHSGSEQGSDSEDSDQASSIDNLKKKIKERMSSFKSSVCDPDTSDEEEQQVKEYKQKKPRKTKPTSPKPQRMTAKQAMENMNKIKSESNRMLREKEVSLPYHRPKALSLKDIMSRRQPALAANGKALPIKMNVDQLREYAKMLEERQKKMAELWQSDNEDDENDDEVENNVNTLKTDENQENTVENPENTVVAVENPEINSGIADNNEMTKQTTTNTIEPSEITKDNFNDSDRNFDEVIQEHNSTITSQAGNISKEIEMETEEQDSETNLTLHYNDSETSITEEKNSPAKENSNKSQELDMKQLDNSTKTEEVIKDLETSKTSDGTDKNNLEVTKLHSESEKDSQLISLHFDSEIKNGGEDINDSESSIDKGVEIEGEMRNTEAKESKVGDEIEGMDVDGFSDEELNLDDIDNMIENAEIIKEIEDKVNSPLLIRDRPLNVKPKLTGAPGMVIDLDGSSAALPRKSGVQLLKERFCFFSKLKTPEEKERERELKSKPGTLHLKLKQDLEEKMAEQRSLEWAKRLDEEKQQQDELKLLRGEESEDENDIDKIEAKLEEKEGEEQAEELQDNEDNEDEDLEEEELVEDDCDMNDKPRSSNPMIEAQAEESECDETEDKEELDGEDAQDDDNDDDSESDDTSSSEEEEEQTTRKGRILKAFEDSDEEDAKETEGVRSEVKEVSGTVENILESQGGSQDDIIQLAQKHKSGSDDLFTTQETTSSQAKDTKDVETSGTDIDIGTQSFSIMDSTKDSAGIDLNNSGSLGITTEVDKCNNLAAISSVRLDNLSQPMPPLPIPMTQISQSQPIGEDILALCTGNFYDNQFVSPAAMNPPTQELTQSFNSFDDETQKEGVKGEESQKEGAKEGDSQKREEIEDKSDEGVEKLDAPNVVNRDIEDDDEISNTIELKTVLKDKVVDDNLKSILDELHDPEFDSPKPNKFFVGNKSGSQADNHRKKFIIDSDDENNDFVSEQKKRKKIKKKKLEKRALQISDDEEDESDPVQEEYESEIEEEDPERVVEYDSEENEIERKPQSHKKKRKVAEFFEKEAELTSEDEWVGSGDEDEAGLDRMEREAGDDDSFHHARLQRELGLIHMRDVLDQDKREVRIIQELLFEDGDLGGEGRQRKFRWKDNDGVGEDGGNLGAFGDTQEEEFESEEQWRKQRHEREMFLRQMKNTEDQNSSLNVSINRTSIIKANLSSKTMSSLLMEVNPTKTEAKTDSPAVEKKTAKDIPSPKKPFGLLQHNYQGSILNRGQGALARLAALATPLADDDNPKIGSLAPSSKRNFVFAALTPDEKPKVTKRKAESNPITPKLVKKMRTEEKNQKSKNSLLDHLKL